MSFANDRREPPQAGTSTPRSLVDLMYDGFYALFLLKNGSAPQSGDKLAEHMTAFLNDVERKARLLDIDADDIWAAKYAFCAAIDEIILRSRLPMREAWERRPLQLRLFGDQLAGEHFFERLEDLRSRGSVRLQSLEVFHMCLLLGFEGRYALDGFDKLSFMIARLGEEIARMRGKNRAFAPHAPRPDQTAHKLQGEQTLWLVSGLCLLTAVLAYGGFRWHLDGQTTATLAQFNDGISMPPAPMQVTLTLP